MPGIRPIKDDQKICQIQPSEDISELIMPLLSSSFPYYFQNPSDIDSSSMHKYDRNYQRRLVRAVGDDEDNDEDSITKLAAPELKMLW